MIAEPIQDVFWFTSADRQQLLYVSSAFETVWGRPRESLYTYPGGYLNLIVDSIHPSDRDRVIAALGEQFQNEYNQEYRIIRPDGSIRWVRSRAFAVQNPFGETWGFAGFSEDITERKQAEELLHQREQEFRVLVELSPDIISRFDRELRHRYVNPAIELATGMPPQEFIGKTHQELGMPQELLSLWEQSLQKVFQTIEPDEHEFTFLTPNGPKYYQSRLVPELATDGSVASVLGICRDITKNKQTEELLRESEERFRTVFEFAPIGIAIADSQGILQETNQAVQEILGYTKEELQHRPCTEFTHPDDRAESLNLWQELFAGKRTHLSQEKRYVRNDGCIVWVNLSATAVCDGNGLSNYAIAMIQDISVQKQAQLELQQAHDELEKRVAERTILLEQANTLLLQEVVERQQAQEALNAQKDFLQTVIDTNPNMIFVKDREGKIMLANQAYAEFRGMTIEDLLGLRDADLNRNDAEVEQFGREDQEVFANSRQVFISEEAGCTTTGEECWYQINKKPLVSSDSQVFGVLGVCTDITARKQAEEALRQSHAFLQTVIDTNPSPIFVKDREGKFILVNQAYAELHGISVEELLGLRDIELYVNLTDTERFLAQDEEVFVTLKPKFISEEVYHTWTGEVRWYQTIKQPIFSSNGQVCQVLGVSTNITQRKLLTEELQEQKAFLQMVIDTNPNKIFVKDTKGKYVLVNQACADFWGMSIEDMIGKTDAQLNFNQANTELFLAHDREVLTTLEQQFFPEVACHTLGGEMCWYQTIKKPIFSSNGQVSQLFGVCTDITERKLAQEALRLSETRFRLAVEHIPDVFVIYDAQRRFQFVNAQGLRISGKTLEEHLGYRDEEIWFNQVTAEYLPMLKRAVETRTLQTGECTIAVPNRGTATLIVTYVPVLDERGEIYQILGITHDITQRKLSEEQLRESEEQLRRSEEQLRLALVAGRMGFWDWNLQTEEVIWSNHVEQLFGLDASTFERTYDAFLARIHLEDRDRVDSHTQRCLETGENYDLEFRVVLPDGTIRWLENKGQVIYEATGAPVRMIGVSLDISDRKLAEQRIKDSLQEKEVLLREIHHRVKNNLQVISSLLDLQSQYIEDQAALEMFRESCTRVKSMALVHEKLYQSKDCAKINFAEYIENLISYLFQAYGVNLDIVTLELKIDEITLNINTAIPCGLIISELVSNSLKHAFPNNRKGSIYVVINSELDNDFTLIVKDNGVGFPENSDIKNGKTLGLQLIQVLTNQLDGELELTCDRGSEVKIRFPKINS